MSFDWNDYVTLANDLFDRTDVPTVVEACNRSSISRAYYAAFISARNLADGRGWITKTELAKDHGIVKRHFSQSRTSKDKMRVGKYLGRLRFSRGKADYEDEFPGHLAEAKLSIDRASTVMELLAKL